MKRIYLIDVDCKTSLGQELVNTMNEKISCEFYSRKKALAYLKWARTYLKERFFIDIESIKKQSKEEHIVLCLWKGCDVNYFFESDYSLVDTRLVMGRY